MFFILTLRSKATHLDKDEVYCGLWLAVFYWFYLKTKVSKASWSFHGYQIKVYTLSPTLKIELKERTEDKGIGEKDRENKCRQMVNTSLL